MSEILNRIKSVASIEEIETEQQQLREEQASCARQIDALEVFRKALLIERDGKPERTWSTKRGASRVIEPKAAPAVKAVVTAPPPGTPQPWDNEDLALGERVRAYLKYFNEATVAEISRGLRVPYGTVYGHLKKSNDIDKTGELYSLQVA